MHIGNLRPRTWVVATAMALLAFSSAVSADPPTRIARLGYTSGAVSLSPAGEDDWTRALVNRPLTTGDRLWTDQRSRAEVQVGGAMVRLGSETSLSVLNLDERVTQLQLTQGTLNVRVRRLDGDQAFEVDTPHLAFTLRQPGLYRIEVDPEGRDTTIVVRKGQGQVYGEQASYMLDARQPYRFSGTDLQAYERVAAPRPDEFDRWCDERDRVFDNSASARYVSQDVLGYQDLDDNGSWRSEPGYGRVWVPNRVAAGWAPYSDGHWTWVDPWGWTWVDDAPWGFAVSHYGRWAHLRDTWAWVPGPVNTRAYYAPALVAFVGGSNFQLTISSGSVAGVAWFPLAPREVYRPSYPVSRGYFENVNRSNTVVNQTVINNTYNSYNTTTVTNVTNVVYANRQVAGAVVAVPTAVFAQSQPVSRAAVRVSSQQLASAPVAAAAPVAPTQTSVHGAGAAADKPPAQVLQRRVLARTAPPVAHPGFAAQQPALSAKPGKPLDDATRKTLTPTTTGPAPAVQLLAPARAAQPATPPPARQPQAAGVRQPAPTPTPTPAAVPTPAVAAPASPQGAKPEPGAKPEQRGRPEPAAERPRGRDRQPNQGAAPAPAAPAPAPAPAPAREQPPVPQPKVAPPPPAEPRGNPIVPPPAKAAPAVTAKPPEAHPPMPAVQKAPAPPAQAAASAPPGRSNKGRSGADQPKDGDEERDDPKRGAEQRKQRN